MFKALELFSGIGAFAEAAAKRSIQVVAAFDQDPRANSTYLLNHGLKPAARNLDTITSEELPAADLWWMSPPCQPYSVRGNQRGLSDPRSNSFVNLMGHIKDHKPKVFMMENVSGFINSDAHRLAEETFRKLGYQAHLLELSPANFGIPMRRPRLYLVATVTGITFKTPESGSYPEQRLESFVQQAFSDALLVSQRDFDKYAPSLHIIKPTDPNAYAICFTSGYWKSYRSSGTFIEVKDGAIRRFSPDEIVSLMGFSCKFTFPGDLSLQAKLQLAGNTVDVRAIDYLLAGLRIVD